MIKELLKKNQLVATSQRIDILQLMHNNQNYMSVSEINEHLTDLDVSTIYRTLSLFDEHKLVIKQFDEQLNAFKYKYLTHNHYHHLKCIKCHEIFEIDFCPMNVYDTKEAKDNGFIITDYQFEIYGYCANCQQLV